MKKNRKIYDVFLKAPGWLSYIPALKLFSPDLKQAQWLVAVGLHETLMIQGDYRIKYE